MKTIKKCMNGCALAAILFTSPIISMGAPPTGELVDGIIANVGPDFITYRDLQKIREQSKVPGKLKALYGIDLGATPSDDDLMNFLTEEKLISIGMKAAGATSSVGTGEVESFITRTGLKRERLLKMLEQEGMTYEGYQKTVAKRLARGRFLMARVYRDISIDDNQVKGEVEARLPPEIFYKIRFVFLSPEEVVDWRKFDLKTRKIQFSTFKFENTPAIDEKYMSELSEDVVRYVQKKPRGYVTPIIQINKKFAVIKIDDKTVRSRSGTEEYEKSLLETRAKLIQEARRRHLEEWVRGELFNLKVERIPHASI